MFELQIIQAKHGDCFLVKMGKTQELFHLLIDGGPSKVYETNLREELKKIQSKGGKLDLIISSHVDSDHIKGLLELTTELVEQRAHRQSELINIKNIWHNAFSQTVGRGSDLEPRIRFLHSSTGIIAQDLPFLNLVIQGISQGYKLMRNANLLDIQINDGFPDGYITSDRGLQPIKMSGFTLTVVGPTRKNLAALRKKWRTWLKSPAARPRDAAVMAMADKSIPNLSSIMILIEGEGKRLLLTGDGRGDHLIQGLKQAKLLDTNGKIFVDVLKLPHHGSENNITKKFFEKVLADKYIISANGKHGNPDYKPLKWIVETTKELQRSIEIVCTNKTDSLRQLQQNYDSSNYKYRLTFMEQNSNAMTISV